MSATIRRLALPVGAIALSLAGAYMGLVVAPPDALMGEVYRIMFVHVPAAWMSLVAYTVGLIASIAYLVQEDRRADALAHSSIELGALFNLLLVVTGAIWGKPTWGVYWSWDPRLTTATIMLFAFLGYLSLRRLVADAERQATWGAVVAILAAAMLPLVWFSVKWWHSLHQLQSSPATMAAPMVQVLRINAFAFLGLYLWLLSHRYQLALTHSAALASSPPPRRAAA